MSLRELYEACLIELQKESAASMLLEDFNHFANKAVQQYINKRYNIYDTSQQVTDDLRALNTTAILTPIQITENDNIQYLNINMEGTFVVEIPEDYWHILNCVCYYTPNNGKRCKAKDSIKRAKATKLTADMVNEVMDNYWNKPSISKPYYYLHHINRVVSKPTDAVASAIGSIQNTGIDGAPTLGKRNADKNAQERYGNASKVLLEIRCGRDSGLQKVMIDYLKTPQHLKLIPEQLDSVQDTSQILEFPDYVCQEILNELVHIVMENNSDQRIQTHPVVSQSIVAQQQANQ